MTTAPTSPEAIARYDADNIGTMAVSSCGDYVRHDDYEALAARLAEVEAERDEWKSASTRHHPNPADHRYWEGRYRDEKARADTAEAERDTALAQVAVAYEVAASKIYGIANAWQDNCWQGMVSGVTVEVFGFYAPYYEAKMRNTVAAAEYFATTPADATAALTAMLDRARGETIDQVKAKIIGMPRRTELIGGQNHEYVQLAEVIGWLDATRAAKGGA